MSESRKTLPPERLGVALQVVLAWRNGGSGPLSCPACGCGGLAIEDRSARPHAEWYALNCATCGLDHVLHIPMAAPMSVPD